MGIQNKKTDQIQNYIKDLEYCITELDDVITKSQEAFHCLAFPHMGEAHDSPFREYESVQITMLNSLEGYKALLKYVRNKYAIELY